MKIFSKSFFVAHILMIILLVIIITPGKLPFVDKTPLLFGICFIELLYLCKLFFSKGEKNDILVYSDILIIVWLFLLFWEIFTTKFNLMHPVLVPTPEDVFNVFATQYKVLLMGVISSMKLLFVGMLFGTIFGVMIGLPVGWIPRLKGIFQPIANVLTPIPPVVFAPYLIALMPTFRSASALVIFLGVFWPTFLNVIIRTGSIERHILDLAKVMNVNNFTMIRKILLPYIMPSIVMGLKMTLTNSVMMLTFAEMMGATTGMGFYIINYTSYANYTNVVAGIILVGVVVTILNRIVNIIQSRMVRWW